MRHSSCRTALDVYTRAVDQQKCEASIKVVGMDAARGPAKFKNPFRTLGHAQGKATVSAGIANKELFWWTCSGSNPMTSYMP
jgi:hypothetical protein